MNQIENEIVAEFKSILLNRKATKMFPFLKKLTAKERKVLVPVIKSENQINILAYNTLLRWQFKGYLQPADQLIA